MYVSNVNTITLGGKNTSNIRINILFTSKVSQLLNPVLYTSVTAIKKIINLVFNKKPETCKDSLNNPESPASFLTLKTFIL